MSNFNFAEIKGIKKWESSCKLSRYSCDSFRMILILTYFTRITIRLAGIS